MTLPGTNYAKKPYIDDGSPLPSIGQRVRNFGYNSLCSHAEGDVIDIDEAGRRVKIEGFIWHPGDRCRGISSRREEFVGWVPWQDVEVTTEDQSAMMVAGK
jgi:hypothetical protein